METNIEKPKKEISDKILKEIIKIYTAKLNPIPQDIGGGDFKILSPEREMRIYLAIHLPRWYRHTDEYDVDESSTMQNRLREIDRWMDKVEVIIDEIKQKYGIEVGQAAAM